MGKCQATVRRTRSKSMAWNHALKRLTATCLQNTVELESFDPREAHAFVLRVLPDSVPSYVTPLVAPLRYLPLSVSLAVSMLGEFEMKVIVDDFVLRV